MVVNCVALLNKNRVWATLVIITIFFALFERHLKLQNFHLIGANGEEPWILSFGLEC